MEQVADKVGLRTDLMATFHENAEIVNDVLTLAYYSFATGNSWSRAARWQKLEKAPSSRELTPMTITRLTQSISETERMNLFKYRADRLDKDELCAVDSTTRSCSGRSRCRCDFRAERSSAQSSIQSVERRLLQRVENPQGGASENDFPA